MQIARPLVRLLFPAVVDLHPAGPVMYVYEFAPASAATLTI